MFRFPKPIVVGSIPITRSKPAPMRREKPRPRREATEGSSW